MPHKNALQINNRADFSAWLMAYHTTEKECYVVCKRGKPTDTDMLYYMMPLRKPCVSVGSIGTIREVDGVNM